MGARETSLSDSSTEVDEGRLLPDYGRCAISTAFVAGAGQRRPSLGDGVMVTQRFLVPLFKVRVLVPQPC